MRMMKIIIIMFIMACTNYSRAGVRIQYIIYLYDFYVHCQFSADTIVIKCIIISLEIWKIIASQSFTIL